MASDDSLLPWDDQEILNFAEKLYAGKLFIFFMGFACKHKQKPNQKKEPGTRLSSGEKAKNGVREGERAAEPGDMPLMVRHSMMPDCLALRFFCLR